MRKLILILGLAVFLPATATHAQIASPNPAGVSMGHVHFLARDVDAYRKMFIAMGGTPTGGPNGTSVKFPGVIVIFVKGDPSSGYEGNVIVHVGFLVPDLLAAQAKWQAAGLRAETGPYPAQIFVYTPDNLARIEIHEDKAQKIPIVFQHIHYVLAEPAPDGGSSVSELQTWYVKVFGAKPTTRGSFVTADLPGVNLTFSKWETPTAPTKGSVLDHIGFEVVGLEAFCKKLVASGVKLDVPYTKPNEMGVASAYLTDPWGTYIHLTEGLSKLQ